MKDRTKLAVIAWACVLPVGLVASIALAGNPTDGPPKEAAYSHTIRLIVVEAMPLEPIAGVQPFVLTVERFYGKIEKRSFDLVKQHETQRFKILFPAAPDAVVKPGDIVDYEITQFLSRDTNAAGLVPTEPAVARAAGPRQPGGVLGKPLGTYLTIEGEGVLTKGFKIETGTVSVDTIDGEKLHQPIRILLHNLRNPLPPGQRFVLKGYETGAMIGVPPAAFQAAAEQGRDDVNPSPVDYQWRPYFEVLIAVEPAGLELLHSQ